jgi:hypothetical protein
VQVRFLSRLLNSAYGGFLAHTARSGPSGNACSGSNLPVRRSRPATPATGAHCSRQLRHRQAPALRPNPPFPARRPRCAPTSRWAEQKNRQLLAIFRIARYGACLLPGAAGSRAAGPTLFDVGALLKRVQDEWASFRTRIDTQPVEKSTSVTEIARDFAASGLVFVASGFGFFVAGGLDFYRLD